MCIRDSDNTLPTVIDLTKANSLNRIPLPKQGDTGRDLYIEREEDEHEPKPLAKTQQQPRKLEPKPIQHWKSAEWRDALKNKEFTDDGIRWMIVDVLYDRSEKVYMAIYIPRGEDNISKNRERTPLKEIFELAKETENWVKSEYLSSI